VTGDASSLRRNLLEATLTHVPFDGWGRRALLAGARDLGLAPEVALNAFPGNGAELIALHSAEADRRMLEALAARDLAPLRTREKIALAIRLRLEESAKDREAIRRALSFLALPQNALLAARLIYRSVDAIWYAAGDTATDWNFYTKRGLLAGVYATTLAAWLEDTSEGFAETWAFLDRRIEDAMTLPRRLGNLGKLARRLPNPAILARRLKERRKF
jgi:ubiquinone biosynthesis protein COQ9